MSTKRCYYEVLSCSREASAEEIRKAYKREALKNHPDRNPGDADAEGRFKEANEAFQVLSDAQKREIYDQFGHAGLEGGRGFDAGGMGDVFSQMHDIFSEMFAGGGGFGPQRPRRGADLRVQVRLTLREAAFGVKKEISVRAPTRCGDCGGSGAKAGTKPEVCTQCRGSGQVSSNRGFVMFTSTCPRCHGQGATVKHACRTCEGHGAVEKTRKVVVAFPAGIDVGQRLRVAGQGLPGPAPNLPPGDLSVEIDVEEDPRFERDGADLVTRVHVSMTAASLGAEIQVPMITAEGDATHPLPLPAGSQSGAVFTVKGCGIPRLDGRGRGSLIAVIQVDVPTGLSDRARELLKELDEELRASAIVNAHNSEATRAAK